MLATAPDAAPAAASDGGLRHRILAGRLWVGPFLVPERAFLLPVRCPSCGGPAFHSEGDLTCLWCARDLTILAVSPGGRILALGLRHPNDAVLVRIAPGQSRRTARALSRADGGNGLAARVLKLVPFGPEHYAVAERISSALSVRRNEVRTALEQLEAQGLVASFSFHGGYRLGWRRVPRAAPPARESADAPR